MLRAGRPVHATLLAIFEGRPLLAFSMTHPEWKRRGLARASPSRCVDRLARRRFEELHLFVTRGNVPAERLHGTRGFQDVPVGS